MSEDERVNIRGGGTGGSGSSGPTDIKTVMITGANGFIGSHIVKILLEKGYTVHACVRDATQTNKVQHLTSLSSSSSGKLKLFSIGNLQNVKSNPSVLDVPMQNCDAVIHSATPLISTDEGERDIFIPAMESTQTLLDCIAKQHQQQNDSSSTTDGNAVKCLILTSSMAAIAPKPEPPVKDETHWSNPDEQKSRGSWYGATKTCQEQLVQEWVESSKTNGVIPSNFKYVAICPTFVLGPPIVPDKTQLSGSMMRLCTWFKDGLSDNTTPNDSMSFVHVSDCARMHVNALEFPTAHGRYMCLVESLHWNDIVQLMKGLYPKMPPVQLYEGEDVVTPTKFDLSRMKMLLKDVKSAKEIFQDSLKFLQSVGELE